MPLELAQLGREALGLVMPPDSCPFDFIDVNEEGPIREEFHKARRENRRWRWRIAGAVLCLIGFSVWVFFFSGFTLAADVDKKIKDAIQPIQVEIQNVSTKLDQASQSNAVLTRAIVDQLATREADSICRLLVARRKETEEAEKRRLRFEADDAQERYKEYKKEYYDEKRCWE